jgi:endonuclease G
MVNKDAENFSALRQALAELEKARNKPYYDQQKDRANRDAYFEHIQVEDINGKLLFQQLHHLLEKTHTTRLTYDIARHQHLYPRVDLHPDKMLRSIYTGQAYEPETIIRKDFEIQERLLASAREELLRMANMNEAALAGHLDILAAAAAYNAEHVVPQSWFAGQYPMKADLHHLFTCEAACNEFRGNTPFFEFPDFRQAIRPGCGKKEANKFEPSQGHGAVARATLYFLLRYPKQINNNTKEYTSDRIGMLIDWHEKNPVSQYELHRNAEIFKVQGNRNPLIDYPGWAGRIDLSLGLA